MSNQTFLEIYNAEKSKPRPPKPPMPPTPGELFIAKISQVTTRSAQTIRGWLSGRPIDPAALKLLCDYFEATPETLFPNIHKTDKND